MPEGGRPYLENPERPGELLFRADDGSIIPIDADLAAALQAEFPEEVQGDLFAQGRVTPPAQPQATDATPAPTQRVGGVFGEGGFGREVVTTLVNPARLGSEEMSQALEGNTGPSFQEMVTDPLLGTPVPVEAATVPGYAQQADQPAPVSELEGPPTVLDEARAQPPGAPTQPQGPQAPPGNLLATTQGQDIGWAMLEANLNAEGWQIVRSPDGNISVVPVGGQGGGVSRQLRARARTAEEAFNNAFQQMQNDIMQGAELQGKEAEGAAGLLGGLDDQLRHQEEQFQADEQQRQQEIDRELDELGQRMDHFSSLRVEPGRVFASSGGAAGLSAAVNVAAGMLASAITNGLAPGTDLPNTALQILESAVENDVRAQMANADIASQSVANQNSLLTFMMGRVEDQRGVEEGLRAVLLQRASNMLEQHMLRMQSPQVRNQAQLVLDRMNLNIAAAQQQALQAAMRRAGRGRRPFPTALITQAREMAGQELDIHRYGPGEPQRPGSVQERQQAILPFIRNGAELAGGFVVTDEGRAQEAYGRASALGAAGAQTLENTMRQAEPYVSTRRGLRSLIELTAPENTQWASPTWRQQVQAAAAGVRMDVVGNLYNQGALQALDFEAAERIVADATSVRGAFDLGQRQSLVNLERALEGRIQNFAPPGVTHRDMLPGNPGRGSQRPSTARPAGPGE